MLVGKSNEEKIWNYFKSMGLNDFGVSGLLGNLFAESGLKSNNLQSTGNTQLGMTDDEYVVAVDNGTYTNFIKDSHGFGIAQWTYWSRKKALYEYAKSKGKSIGDLEMQLNFLYKELSEKYKSVLYVLRNATSVFQASNAVLLKYEKPADQSEKAQNKRAGYSQIYYNKYGNKVESMSFKMRTTKPEAGNKYYITKANGGYSDAVKGNPTYRDKDCDVLPNCVGYSYGRFNEIGDYGYCKYLKPVNAENFIQYKDEELEVGQTPKLGACMVWQKGDTLSNSDGAGHVAIVEKIVSNTEVYTSESGWNSSNPFWNQTRVKGDGNWGQNSSYKFLGFIYNPAVEESENTPLPSPAPSPTVLKYKIGDIVVFVGNKHYSNSNSNSPINCKSGAAKVTAISNGSKHPYHLIADKNGTSTVYGWVDESDVSGKIPSTNKTINPKAKVESAKSFSISVIGKYKTTNTLNMRSGAGTSKTILTVIPKGGKVTCYGYYTSVSGIKWYRVNYKTSNKRYTGFVSSEYLSK